MTQTPYLSVVATARNDNHGGNMLRRMQIFINGWIEQSRRYNLETELIIVEWNPPGDRPSLAEALSWNVDGSPCTVRIIEVPPILHQRLRYAEALPLFQMIAKNVGIRRAQGEFILATNIDLLFSDSLFEFMASRQMQPGYSYRLDRYDAASEVPLEAPLSEQLAYCEKNLLRINRRGFIEELTPEPLVEPEVIEPEVVTEDEMAGAIAPSPRWYEQLPDSSVSWLTRARSVYRALLPKTVKDAVLRTLPTDFVSWLIARGLLTEQAPPPPPLPPEEPITIEDVPAPEPPPWQYPQLHTNACGDFTLMSKADWFAIRGYPEWEIFSFHLDSVLLYVAHYAGIKESILHDPMRAYHIEHSSGWTPQTERTQTLNKRLAKLGIPQLSNEQFDALARLMEQTGQPLIVNDEHWGMAQEQLPETEIASTMVAVH